MISALRSLYEGNQKRSYIFRYALLILDGTTLGFLVVSSFFYGHAIVHVLEAVVALYITLDFCGRWMISRHKLLFLIRPYSIIDIAVLFSFLAPLLAHHLIFLRAITVLRLLRSYHVLNRLRQDVPFFRTYEDTVLSAVNLALFVFIMTEMVLQTQIGSNDKIHNFLDAMYFTIATLTTTGFGDVVLYGTSGRVLSILIMICGVSLFLRLIQTIFRPHKVRFQCQACGLYLHERDAVHCKSCGALLNIPDDGQQY